MIQCSRCTYMHYKLCLVSLIDPIDTVEFLYFRGAQQDDQVMNPSFHLHFKFLTRSLIQNCPELQFYLDLIHYLSKLPSYDLITRQSDLQSTHLITNPPKNEKNKTQNFWTLWVVTWKEVASYNNKNNHLILFWGASRDSIFSLTANFHVENVAWVHNIMLHMANSMCVFFSFKQQLFIWKTDVWQQFKNFCC